MAKTVLEDVYQLLHGIGAVRSESEFSKDWLGRSIAICASKLQHYGQRMLATTEHEQLGQRFVSLSNACHRQINTQSKRQWMAAL